MRSISILSALLLSTFAFAQTSADRLGFKLISLPRGCYTLYSAIRKLSGTDDKLLLQADCRRENKIVQPILDLRSDSWSFSQNVPKTENSPDMYSAFDSSGGYHPYSNVKRGVIASVTNIGDVITFPNGQGYVTGQRMTLKNEQLNLSRRFFEYEGNGGIIDAIYFYEGDVIVLCHMQDKFRHEEYILRGKQIDLFEQAKFDIYW